MNKYLIASLLLVCSSALAHSGSDNEAQTGVTGGVEADVTTNGNVNADGEAGSNTQGAADTSAQHRERSLNDVNNSKARIEGSAHGDAEAGDND